jgi:hypothetical protein
MFFLEHENCTKDFETFLQKLSFFMKDTIIPFQIWNKLHCFIINQIFWILIVSYDKN